MQKNIYIQARFLGLRHFLFQNNNTCTLYHHTHGWLASFSQYYAFWVQSPCAGPIPTMQQLYQTEQEHSTMAQDQDTTWYLHLDSSERTVVLLVWIYCQIWCGWRLRRLHGMWVMGVGVAVRMYYRWSEIWWWWWCSMDCFSGWNSTSESYICYWLRWRWR